MGGAETGQERVGRAQDGCPEQQRHDGWDGTGDPDRLGREFQRCCGEQQARTHRHAQSDLLMGQPGEGPGDGSDHQPDRGDRTPGKDSADLAEARGHRVSPIVATTDRP
ncbi:hypothetical protein Anae109_1052 [Anaeromyxobacter sp. Fw109-5]|nr:hypothetical protein Anae109_1052 [Anaeromyxobacter sp. Fw109-5]